MAEIVNLNQFRKRRQRQETGQNAAENRRRFGASKSEREMAERERKKFEKELDDKRLE